MGGGRSGGLGRGRRRARHVTRRRGARLGRGLARRGDGWGWRRRGLDARDGPEKGRGDRRRRDHRCGRRGQGSRTPGPGEGDRRDDDARAGAAQDPPQSASLRERRRATGRGNGAPRELSQARVVHQRRAGYPAGIEWRTWRARRARWGRGAGGLLPSKELRSIAAIWALRLASASPAVASTQSPTLDAVAGAIASSSALAMSRAVAKRAAGSTLRPRITTSSRAAGTPFAIALGRVAQPARITLSRCASLSPRNRRLPVSASQSTTDAAYTSVARETDPASCSGDMYESFPFTCPSFVVWSRPTALATPKSSTRAIPSVPTRMFCGVTSRCTRPRGSPALFVASWAA